VVGLFDSSVRLVIPDLNKPQDISTERIRTVLGWEPRSKEDAIISMAESMIKHGLIKDLLSSDLNPSQVTLS
jgi:dihydroflavonol-4-reductase